MVLFYDGGDGNDVVLIASPTTDTVYVDDDWTGTLHGADPDAGGPATLYGIDAFDNITDALAAVNAGGTIIVFDGSYNESLTVAKDVTIQADNPGSVIIDAGSTFTGVAIASGSTAELVGLDLTGFLGTGIDAVGNLVLDQSSVSGGFTGVSVDGSTATITNSTVSGASIFGIEVTAGSSLSADSSEFLSNGTAGILVSNGSASITGSTISGNGRGVLVGAAGSVTIHGSNLAGNTGDAVENASATIVNASGNWWGSVDETVILNATTGLVDFTPFLNSGTDGNGSDAGFVGDSSALNVTTLGKQSGTSGRVQEGVDTVSTGGDVYVLAGTYAENVVINQSVQLLGPNAGIDPNTGSRVAEAVIVPAISDIDGSVNGGMVIEVRADNVTVDGLTVDGDNTSITTGYGYNGADMDAAEAVASYSDIGGLVVQNNILQNLSYTGVTIFGSSYSAPSSSGNVVSNNLIQNLGVYDPGSGIEKWGMGVLIYNDQYTAITDNVMTDVRVGIQTGNFHDPNPGTTASQVISGNQIAARRLGIFHNLFTGNSAPFTVSSNTITAIDEVQESGWIGILLSSLDDHSIVENNAIDGSGTSLASSGYQVWNVSTDAAITIDGGTITGVDRGIWVNNFEGYNSDAGYGAHVTIDGVNITASEYGIYVLDSPSSTNGSSVSAIVTKHHGRLHGGNRRRRHGRRRRCQRRSAQQLQQHLEQRHRH